MFDINIDLNEIIISSVEREDIIQIQKWINSVQTLENELQKPLNFKEFYERFLEYYVSENEFFLKINNEDKLIGILKGRIEFKSKNEVFFWYFLLDMDSRGKGIGSKIIDEVINYFSNDYGIDIFFTAVIEQDSNAIRFWKKSNFELVRISKDFFNINGKDMDMLIMKKIDYNT